MSLEASLPAEILPLQSAAVSFNTALGPSGFSFFRVCPHEQLAEREGESGCSAALRVCDEDAPECPMKELRASDIGQAAPLPWRPREGPRTDATA